MKRTMTVALMLVVLLPIRPSFAEAPVYEARELFQQATFVYLARVESVDTEWLPPWRKVATATVLEVWKGKKVESVKFRASPSWECDTSQAEEGEVVVLMLEPDTDEYLQIVNSGQGRFPVSKGQVGLIGWEIDGGKDAETRNQRVVMSLQELRRLVSRPS